MPETVDTVIDGGIVAFSSNAFEASIAIKGEKIVAVGNKSTMPKAENYIDATGKYVLPGLIDCHVHIREKPGDDWGIGSKAAALAGLTTIIPFGEYNSEKNNTRESILKIDSSIQFMKKLEDDYKIDESVKDIVEKMNEYSKKLLENNKMRVSKEKYIEKRKELNSHLYFIQKLNKWNTAAICPICITSKIDSYCNPCGHTACKKCLERKPSNGNNLNNSNKCPICREYIMDIRKLFFI